MLAGCCDVNHARLIHREAAEAGSGVGERGGHDVRGGRPFFHRRAAVLRHINIAQTVQAQAVGIAQAGKQSGDRVRRPVPAFDRVVQSVGEKHVTVTVHRDAVRIADAIGDENLQRPRSLNVVRAGLGDLDRFAAHVHHAAAGRARIRVVGEQHRVIARARSGTGWQMQPRHVGGGRPGDARIVREENAVGSGSRGHQPSERVWLHDQFADHADRAVQKNMAVHQPAAHVAAGGGAGGGRHRPTRGRVGENGTVLQLDAEDERLAGQDIHRVKKIIVRIGEEVRLQIGRVDGDGLHGEPVQMERMHRDAAPAAGRASVVGNGQLQHTARPRPECGGRMRHVRPGTIAAVAVERRGRIVADVRTGVDAIGRRAVLKRDRAVLRAVGVVGRRDQRIRVQQLEVLVRHPDGVQDRRANDQRQIGVPAVRHHKKRHGIVRSKTAEVPRTARRAA